MKYPNGRILVFCKAPQAGKVKTRLAKTIGEYAATSVHEYLSQHCLKRFVQFNIAPVELWCAPNTDHDFFQQCHDTLGVTLKEQVGDDLGERMSYALNKALQHHFPVILVGTDCPGITSNYLLSAFSEVMQNKTVIGPAEDGGYVLLGTKRIQHDIFLDMPWGSSRVCRETILRLTGEVKELPLLWDVDHVGDLRRLRDSADQLQLAPEFTDYLQKLELS